MSSKKMFLSAIDGIIEDLKAHSGEIVLYIHMPTGETETIKNPNVQAKRDYIERAYDDDLHLKSCPEIYIEDYEIRVNYGKKVK